MKKLLSILLTLAMVIALCSLAGCSKEKSANSDTSAKASTKASGEKSDGYPKNALLSKEIRHNTDGTTECLAEYTYDEKGNMLKRFSYYDGELDFTTEYVYTYDDKGNITKAVTKDNEGNIKCWYEYAYDANGNRISQRYYGYEGNLEWDNSEETWDASYDENGNKIAERYFDKNGTVVSETTFNSNGDIESGYSFNEDGEKKLSYANAYDEKGRHTELRVFDENGNVTFWFEWKYGEDGEVQKYRYNADGSINWAFSDSLVYDEMGNEISLKKHNEDGTIDEFSVYTSAYTYDDNGNITSYRYYTTLDADSDLSFYDEWYDATYDANGNMLTKQEYKSDGEKGDWTEYIYLNQSGPEKAD